MLKSSENVSEIPRKPILCEEYFGEQLVTEN